MAPVMVIPVFIPHRGCPHRCIFCNQTVITSDAAPAVPGPGDIHRIISDYLGYKGKRRRVELAFFGGNFLGLPEAEILGFLDAAASWLERGEVQSVRCSTRPDTITPKILEQVRPLGLTLVELGVQSLDDGVLEQSLRGHTRADSLAAVELLRSAGMGVGIQLMTGLPGDTRDKCLETARVAASLKPDLVRIYPLLVLEGSPLAASYRRGLYRPQTLDEAVELVGEMVRILEGEGIIVARMGLQAGEGLEDENLRLAGPWHPAFGHLVRSALMLEQVWTGMENLPAGPWEGRVVLGVHPRSESRLRGDKNANLKTLGRVFPGVDFQIRKDPALAPDRVDIISLP